MKELLSLIKIYEERNNFDITVSVHGDGSGTVKEFVEEERLFAFDTLDELKVKLLTRNDNQN